MIDKKISLGTVITICTILGTFIYTQGFMTSKMESFEKDANTQSIKVNKNSEDIDNLNISVAKVETKIDEWGKRLETLILEQ